MTTKERLQDDMMEATEKQKNLLEKRNLLLGNENSKNQEKIIRITHELARLEDFIKMAKNTLTMQIKISSFPKK